MVRAAQTASDGTQRALRGHGAQQPFQGDLDVLTPRQGRLQLQPQPRVPVVRAEFLRGRNLEYVRAARALGLSDGKIMFRHILPNAMVSTLTFLPFIFTGAIGVLTSLDFLGFGLPPGSPSLGELVAQSKNNLSAPWLGLSAFFTLSIMLTLLVFIGEAARDAFDPRKAS